MKKFIQLTAVSLMLLGSSACSTDDEKKDPCPRLTENLQAANEAYNEDPEANCTPLKNAIEAYIDAQCSGYEDLEPLLTFLSC